MIRHLVCACMGAALVVVSVVPARVAAKPPDLPEDGTFTVRPACEVLPMPNEVSDVTCPYLRQKMIEGQVRQSVDALTGRDVTANLKRLSRADKLLAKAKELARDGLFVEALFCCNEAAELCPGSPCAQRAIDTMVQIALNRIESEGNLVVTDKGVSEESDEPPTNSHYSNIEVGTNADGGLMMFAEYSLGGSVYHLRYKQGAFKIWTTPDGRKTKP
jgi:hypothetical protein